MASLTRARSKAQTAAVSAPQALPKATKTTAKKITKKTSTIKPSTIHNHLKGKADSAMNVKKPKTATTKTTSSGSEPSAMERCLAGGPNGPKVYDELGFELFYEKCAGINRGAIRRPRGQKYYDMLNESDLENARKREIMGTKKENVSALTSMAWDDRVARELGIPYHKVEMKHFEELAKRGFVGKKGEFEAVNMSEEERERITKLAIGSAFRK